MTATDWRERAACAGSVTSPDDDVFFQVFDDDATKVALAYCAVCPVRVECAAEFKRIPEKVGVWAGEAHQNKREQTNSERGERVRAETTFRRMPMYRAGMTDLQMATAEKVSVSSIEFWRRQNGLPVNRSTRRGERSLTTRRKEWHSWGWTDQQIADREGCKPETIQRWRERWSLPSNIDRANRAG